MFAENLRSIDRCEIVRDIAAIVAVLIAFILCLIFVINAGQKCK